MVTASRRRLSGAMGNQMYVATFSHPRGDGAVLLRVLAVTDGDAAAGWVLSQVLALGESPPKLLTPEPNLQPRRSSPTTAVTKTPTRAVTKTSRKGWK